MSVHVQLRPRRRRPDADVAAGDRHVLSRTEPDFVGAIDPAELHPCGAGGVERIDLAVVG